MSAPRHSRFSPHLVSGDDLDALLVGRDAIAGRLLADLVSAVRTGGARYELLVGPRGAGKSHLSALLRYRLERALSGEAIVVALDEEEHVGSLLGMLARLLRRFPAEEGLPGTADQEQALRGVPRGEAVTRAVTMMEARLEGRALVIFLENLDQLFEDVGREGQQRLRSILQTHPRWSVVATSRTLTPAFTKPQQPFFHTFSPHALAPLTPVECRDQLLRLARIDRKADLAAFLATPTGLARVTAIHHFTGGNPRAMALVYPYLTREKLDELVEAFYGLSEELTPYFQEQMARLASGQRPVLEALAENWRPMSPSELSERLFETPATISVQLKRLRDDRLVTALAVGRERFYEIAEPLHRLARAMKRPDRIGEVLARFLRFWYTEPELDEMLDAAPEHRDVRGHLDGLRAAEGEESAFATACLEEVGRAWKAEDMGRALEVARGYFEREPNETSADALVSALLVKGDEDDARAVVRDLAGRGWIAPVMTLAEWPDAVTPEVKDEVVAALSSVPAESPLRLRAVLQVMRLGGTASMDEVLSLFATAEKLVPTTFSAILETLHARGEDATVVRLVEAAGQGILTVSGGNTWIRSLVALGRWEDARTAVRGLENAIACITLITELRGAGRATEALALARETAERFPTLAPVLLALAIEELRGGNTEEARRASEAATRLDPGDRVAWFALGMALRITDTRSATEAMARSFELRPNPTVGLPLFELLLRAREIDRAREVASRLPEAPAAAFARWIVAILDGAPATIEPAHSVGETELVILAHCLAILASRPGDALRSAFPVEPPSVWRQAAVLVCTFVLPVAATASPAAARDLDTLAAFFQIEDEITLGRAIAALPTSAVPWARLGAEERALGRQLLESAGATTLIARLPAEPSE